MSEETHTLLYERASRTQYLIKRDEADEYDEDNEDNDTRSSLGLTKQANSGTY